MNNNDTNYLDLIPQIPEKLNWNKDKENNVTLEIENKGLVNRIAQKLFKKPKVSFIHLDELGSFVWLSINGNMNIAQITALVKEHFGEEMEMPYERTAKFFQILESYKFINLINGGDKNE